MWVACWKRIAVSDIPGWPLWEKAVHDALHPAFATLRAIFVHAKQGAGFDILAGAHPEAGEYAQLLYECSITGLDGPASLIFATSAADGERDLVTPTSKPESITPAVHRRRGWRTLTPSSSTRRSRRARS